MHNKMPTTLSLNPVAIFEAHDPRLRVFRQKVVDYVTIQAVYNTKQANVLARYGPKVWQATKGFLQNALFYGLFLLPVLLPQPQPPVPEFNLSVGRRGFASILGGLTGAGLGALLSRPGSRWGGAAIGAGLGAGLGYAASYLPELMQRARTQQSAQRST